MGTEGGAPPSESGRGRPGRRREWHVHRRRPGSQGSHREQSHGRDHHETRRGARPRARAGSGDEAQRSRRRAVLERAQEDEALETRRRGQEQPLEPLPLGGLEGVRQVLLDELVLPGPQRLEGFVGPEIGSLDPGLLGLAHLPEQVSPQVGSFALHTGVAVPAVRFRAHGRPFSARRRARLARSASRARKTRMRKALSERPRLAASSARQARFEPREAE